MPERVTREERTISLAIEKARSAKEELLLSLENNRNPLEKDNIMEKVKLTRPKAENYNKKKYEGKHSGFGLGQEATGGDITEFKKSFSEEEKRKIGADLVALLEKDPEEALKEMENKIISRMRESVKRNKFTKSQKEDITEFKKSLDVIKYTIRGEGGVKADKQQIRDIELLIRQVEKDLDGLLDGLKDGSIGQEEFTEKSQELMREFNQEGILNKPNKYR